MGKANSSTFPVLQVPPQMRMARYSEVQPDHHQIILLLFLSVIIAQALFIITQSPIQVWEAAFEWRN